MALAGPQGQTEIPEDWLSKFKREITCYPLAETAWNLLKDAGLGDAAMLLLYGYAKGAEKDVSAMNERATNAARSLKGAARAEKIAQTKAPIRSHDLHQFTRRAQKARRVALRSEWWTPDGSVGTLGSTIEVLGKEPRLDVLARGVVKAAGKRSNVSSPMYFLMLLQEYAANHGVSLGLKRLNALADCAEPKRFLDEGTLGRYLRSIPKTSKHAILRDAILPPPVHRKHDR